MAENIGYLVSPEIEHIPEINDFIEKSDAAPLDAAIDYYNTKIKNDNNLPDKYKESLWQDIRSRAEKYIPEEQVIPIVVSTVANGGSIKDLININHVLSTKGVDETLPDRNIAKYWHKYKDIDIDGAIRTTLQIAKGRGVDLDTAAGLYYKEYVETENITEEQKEKYVDLLTNIVKYKPKKERREKYKFEVPEVDISPEVKDYVSYVNTPKPYAGDWDNIKALEYIKRRRGLKTLSEAKQIVKKGEIKFNREIDKNIYEDVVDFVEENKITDPNEAYNKYVKERLIAKKIRKSDKERVLRSIKLGIDNQTKRNMIYSLPTAGQFIEMHKDKGVNVALGMYYRNVMEPLLEATGADDKKREKVIDNLNDLYTTYTQQSKKSYARQILEKFLDIPMTNAWVMDAAERNLDKTTRELVGKRLVEMYKDAQFTDDSLFDARVEKIAENILAIAAAYIGAGVISGAGKLPKGAKLVTSMAEDAFLGGIPATSITSKIGKGAYNTARKLLIGEIENFEKVYNPETIKVFSNFVVENLAKKSKVKYENMNVVQEVVEELVRGGEKPMALTHLDDMQEVYERAMSNRLAHIVKELGFKNINDLKLAIAREKNVDWNNILLEAMDAPIRKGYSEKIESSYDFINKIDNIMDVVTHYDYREGKLKDIVKMQIGEEAFNDYAKGIKLMDEIENSFKDLDTILSEKSFGRLLVDKLVKPISSLVEETYGVYGKLLTRTIDRVMDYGADLSARYMFNAEHILLSEIPEEILNMKRYRTWTGKFNLEKYINDMYQIGVYKNLSDFYNMKNIDEAILKKQFPIMSDKKLYNILDENYSKFNKIFEQVAKDAMDADIVVTNRALKEALTIKKVDNDQWAIVDKKSGKIMNIDRESFSDIAGYSAEEVGDKVKAIFPTKTMAKEMLDSMTTHPFVPRENYVPLIVDFEKLSKEIGDISKEMIEALKSEDLVEILSDTDVMRSIIRKLGDEKLNEAIKSGKIKKYIVNAIERDEKLYDNFRKRMTTYFDRVKAIQATRRNGHLQYERVYGVPIRFYKVDKGYKIIQSYFMRAGRRIMEIKNFGDDDKVIKNIIKILENRYGASGSALAKQFIDIVFNRVSSDRGIEKMVRNLKDYFAVTRLTLSALSQVMQFGNVISRTNFKNFIKGVKHVAKSDEDFIRLYRMTGTALNEVRMEALRSGYALGRLAEKAIKFYGMSSADMLIRKVASATGMEYAREMAEKFIVNPKKYARYLEELRINPLEVAERFKKGLPLLTDEDLMKAMQKVEIDTNFRNRLYNMPHAFTGQTGQLLTHLLVTSFEQARFMKKYVLDELVKHGNIMPFVYFLASAAIFPAPRDIVRQALRGETYDYDYISQVLDAGLLGIYGNFLEGLYMGYSPVGFAGVTGSFVNNLYNATHAIMQGKAGSALYNILKEVPTVHKIVYRKRYLKRSRMKMFKKFDSSSKFKGLEAL